MTGIQEFAAALRAVPEGEFTDEGVLDHPRRNPVNPQSLERYLYFSSERYARNLVHQTAPSRCTFTLALLTLARCMISRLDAIETNSRQYR